MRRLLPALTMLILASAPALAQINVPGPITTPGGQSSTRRPRAPSDAGPVGVPGARADTSLTGPARPTNFDMSPNDALFDSINRGDLAAAKDALGRGADIHARNVLGLTPLDLAIDLGRNDISFLLLSLRGDDGYSPDRPPKPVAGDRPAKPVRRVAGSPRESVRPLPAKPRTAPLFAGNGGAPVPRAGFLGFDATR